MSILPFMDSEELKELADQIVAGEVTNVSLTMVYPFLKSKHIEELIEQMTEKSSYKQIYTALPFLKKEAINRLYERVQNGELEGFKEEALIPFLGKSQLKDIFNKLVKEAKETDTVEDSVEVLFDQDEDEDDHDDE
jgi:hypothetical protein